MKQRVLFAVIFLFTLSGLAHSQHKCLQRLSVDQLLEALQEKGEESPVYSFRLSCDAQYLRIEAKNERGQTQSDSINAGDARYCWQIKKYVSKIGNDPFGDGPTVKFATCGNMRATFIKLSPLSGIQKKNQNFRTSTCENVHTEFNKKHMR